MNLTLTEEQVEKLRNLLKYHKGWLAGDDVTELSRFDEALAILSAEPPQVDASAERLKNDLRKMIPSGFPGDGYIFQYSEQEALIIAEAYLHNVLEAAAERAEAFREKYGFTFGAQPFVDGLRATILNVKEE